MSDAAADPEKDLFDMEAEEQSQDADEGVGSTTEQQPKRIVRWIGDVGSEMLPRERMITVADWNAVDVANMDDAVQVRWHAGNDYKVPGEVFDFLSDQEFARFIVADPAFSVEDAE